MVASGCNTAHAAPRTVCLYRTSTSRPYQEPEEFPIMPELLPIYAEYAFDRFDNMERFLPVLRGVATVNGV